MTSENPYAGEDNKWMIAIIALVGLIILTGIAFSYVHDWLYTPYAVEVNDKYTMASFGGTYYVIEDLTVPFFHTRSFPPDVWDMMRIGKKYQCQNIDVSMFDFNPHHERVVCEPI